jgi:hypothetical protein
MDKFWKVEFVVVVEEFVVGVAVVAEVIDVLVAAVVVADVVAVIAVVAAFVVPRVIESIDLLVVV